MVSVYGSVWSSFSKIIAPWFTLPRHLGPPLSYHFSWFENLSTSTSGSLCPTLSSCAPFVLQLFPPLNLILFMFYISFPLVPSLGLGLRNGPDRHVPLNFFFWLQTQAGLWDSFIQSNKPTHLNIPDCNAALDMFNYSSNFMVQKIFMQCFSYLIFFMSAFGFYQLIHTR